MDLAHPFSVTARQVVVDGDNMHALARQRIQVSRQRGDQCLAFAGTHLCDFTLVQHHAADKLHVIVAHGFTNRGEGA